MKLLILGAWTLISPLVGLSHLVSPRSYDWASIRCPESRTETLPTPTYGGDGGLFTVCTELLIEAPITAIYNALLDFRNYGNFSSFVVHVDVPPEVANTPDDVFIGLAMTFTTVDIMPLINTTSVEIVTVMKDDMDEGYLMTAWRYDDTLNGKFSRSEHPSILVEQANGKTRYVSFETYYDDPGTLLLIPFWDKLQAGYAQHGEDLKNYIEATQPHANAANR